MRSVAHPADAGSAGVWSAARARAALHLRLLQAGVSLRPHVWTAGVFVASLLIYLEVNLRLIARLPITGDEPWYLLQSYALIHHHTADLSPVVGNQHIYAQFVGGHPDDHTADFRGNGERVLPNLPGYAALIAPFFIVAGRPGIVVFQAVLAAATATLLFTQGRHLFGSLAAGLFAALAYALSLPALFYIGQIFPSTIAAFATFTAFVLIARVLPHAQGRRLVWASIAVGVLAGVLPWLHSKYALTGLALLAIALVTLRAHLRRDERGVRDRSAWWAAAAVVGCVAVSFICIGLYSRHYFGSWLPQVTVHPEGRPSLQHADVRRAVYLYVNMFLSAQSGLIPWVPLDLLVPLGLILLWRRNARQGFYVILLLVAQLGAFLSVIFAPYVYQGWALPARFTADVAPFFALSVAGVFAVCTPIIRVAVAALGRPLAFLIWPSPAGSLPDRSPGKAVGATLAARALAALGCVVLLLAGGWFARIALKDPAMLYGSSAGVRLAAKYPDALPGWWFGSFVETPGIVEYSVQYRGTLPFDQDLSGKDLIRTGQANIPTGHYDAMFTFTCRASTASASSLTFVVEAPGRAYPHGLAQRETTAAQCSASPRSLLVEVPFYSDGYDPFNFAIAASGTATVSNAQVSYAPTPSAGR